MRLTWFKESLAVASCGNIKIKYLSKGYMYSTVLSEPVWVGFTAFKTNETKRYHTRKWPGHRLNNHQPIPPWSCLQERTRKEQNCRCSSQCVTWFGITPTSSSTFSRMAFTGVLWLRKNFAAALCLYICEYVCVSVCRGACSNV